MANSSGKKILIVAAFIGVFSAVGYGVIKATKASNAASKLDYDIDSFTLKSVKQNTLSGLGTVIEIENTTEILSVLENLKAGIPGLGLSLKIPTSLIYTLSLKINNPTDQDLVITNPYIKISVKKNDGTLAKLANTAISSANGLNIKANSTSSVHHDIEFQIINVAKIIPNFLEYIIGRLKGEKSTQKIIADATLDAMGLTIPIQKVINL